MDARNKLQQLAFERGLQQSQETVHNILEKQGDGGVGADDPPNQDNNDNNQSEEHGSLQFQSFVDVEANRESLDAAILNEVVVEQERGPESADNRNNNNG